MTTDSIHIRSLLRRHAARRADQTALSAPGRRPLSWAGLSAQVDETARTLSEMGIGGAQRVAVVLENGPELASAFLSIASAAVFAPLNPSYRAPEFEFYLSDLQAAAVIVRDGDRSSVVAVATDLGIPVIRLRVDDAAGAGQFSLRAGSSGSVITPAGDSTSGRPDDEALVLHTSGTTSRPKMVPLTHLNLCTSADNIRRTLQLTPDDLCLNVMPLFHIHGLIGALLSSVSAGAGVVCTPGFHAPRFFEWLDTFAPTWYTAVPTMHQAIVERASENAPIIERRPLRFIRSSSSSLAPQSMLDLEAAFGAPVVEAYGMTEASHQMACNPLPPGERKPGSVGPAAGPKVAVMADNGLLLQHGATGEIVIRGENVTSGYAGNDAATAEAFRHGWFHTGDEGYLDPDGYVYVTGRIKEIINRGGEKIAPREIDEVLLEHPDVRQAVAFAVPDARLGEEVGVALVPEPDTTLDPQAIRRFVSERLAPFKVPRHIAVVDEIPMGPTGKLRRVGLAEQLAEQLGLPADSSGPGAPTEQDTPTPVAAVLPTSPVERMLSDLWLDILRLDAVSVETPFLDAGGDSMTAVQLASRVRSAFDVDIALVDFFDAPTISKQARLVEDRMLSDQ